MTIKLHPSFAVHPGPWLRSELVGPHGLSVTDAAKRLHVTHQAMSNLLGGRARLSAEITIRSEKLLGVKADTLMRMQAAHDFAQARVGGRGEDRGGAGDGLGVPLWLQNKHVQ